MQSNPYRKPFELDTRIEVQVEKEVAELIQAMSEHAKIPVDEIVNTSLRRYIATHSDYIPKKFKKRALS